MDPKSNEQVKSREEPPKATPPPRPAASPNDETLPPSDQPAQGSVPVAGHRLAQAVYRVRLLIGVIALSLSWALPQATVGQRVMEALLVGLVYLPYSVVLYLLSRRGEGRGLRIASVAGDLAVVFLFETLIPQTKLVALFGYLLILAFHAYLSGLATAVVITGIVIALTAIDEFVLAQGEPLGLFGISMYWAVLVSMTALVHAVTQEQRELLERLRKSEQLLGEAEKLAEVGSWEWDVSRGSVRWSQEMLSIHGLPQTNGPLSFEDATRLIVEHDLPRVLANVQPALDTAGDAQLPDIEYTIIRPDGQRRTLLGRARLIKGHRGPRLVGMVQDITERKRSEESLNEAYERQRKAAQDLRALDEMKEALIQAGLVLASELSLPAVLQKIVSLACDVTGAQYGALGVLGGNGRIEDFITEGISEEGRQAIGSLPVGKGILGALITDARPLRLGRIQEDLRSFGFPPNHPPMASFLGVPIIVRGTAYGNLYLTEKRDGHEFTADDERAAITLASQAGVAIENARLFEEGQERLALQERHRLARELHDSVSQALFSLTLHARAAQLAFEKGDFTPGGKLELHLGQLRELTQAAVAEMKALIFELRPEALREEGLVAALEKQAARIAARDECRVDVEAPHDRLLLHPAVEEQLYRLAQEALTNAVKHSGAGRIKIHFEVAEEERPEVVLEITDDGTGFDPSLARPGHLGLTTMAQRVDRLGGTFKVESAPGAGTTVRATIPIEPEAILGTRPNLPAQKS